MYHRIRIHQVPELLRQDGSRKGGGVVGIDSAVPPDQDFFFWKSSLGILYDNHHHQ